MKKCWKIRNAADSSEEAELLIYGDISDETWWGDEVTPRQFHDDLATLEGKDLCVRINSGGGDVFAAVAIYNQLKTYGGKVTTRIDGLAASAATIIACAGEQVIMPSNALFMIHNPAMFDVLEKIKNLLGMGNAGQKTEEPKNQAESAAKPANVAHDDPIRCERERMMALDALDDHKGGAISKMVDEAKRNGTSAEQLKPFLDIAKAQDDANAENGKAVQSIKDLVRDNLESGAAGVQASMPAAKDAGKQAAIDAVVACANRK